MNSWKHRLLRTLLDTLFLGRVHRLLGRSCRGVGAILTLHHVRPGRITDPFSPNRILDITPEFLERAILQIIELGYEIVTLDQVSERLTEQDYNRKFVAITLDDGYHDNYAYAVPVFNRLRVPFAVYVATGMPDGTSILWWEHLEEIVRHHEDVKVEIDGRELHFKTRSTREKYGAFETVYWTLRGATHAVQHTAIGKMLVRYHIDAAELCRRSAMSWSTLGELRNNRLATIGVHTQSHHALSKLSADAARQEAEQSRRAFEEHLDFRPEHFCYPFGDRGSAGPREFGLIRDLGFSTATTTRKGVLFPEHKDHLHALPRISMNGDYQRSRYLELFLSGTPFALMNGFRRLDVR